MDLPCTAVEMLSPAIGHAHVMGYGEVLALAEEKLGEPCADQSGVIADGSGMGGLIEKNSIKNGKMAFLPEHPRDDRISGLYEFILEKCREYLILADVAATPCQRRRAEERREKLGLERCWFVDQRENDYQILHAHLPNLLSGIIYLDVPDCMNETTYPDGILTLIETNPFIVLPGAGDMYIWPAYMLHHVYPFRRPGRRVALSFNVQDNSPGAADEAYFRPRYVQVSREQYFDRNSVLPHVERRDDPAAPEMPTAPGVPPVNKPI